MQLMIAVCAATRLRYRVRRAPDLLRSAIVSSHSETRTNHGAASHGRGQDVEMVSGTEFLGFRYSHLFFLFCMAKCCPYRRLCSLVLASGKT